MKRGFSYLLIIFICLFIMPFCVEAAPEIPDCSTERTAELSRIASNIQFDYSYDIVKGEPVFYITASNINNQIYVVDSLGVTFREDFTRHYDSGETINFTIYSNDSECRGKQIINRYVSLPKYNPYSAFEECQGKPDLKICQMWTNSTDVSVNDFFKLVRDYENKKVTESKKTVVKDTFWDFISDHRIAIIVGLVVIIVIATGLFIRKRMTFLPKK